MYKKLFQNCFLKKQKSTKLKRKETREREREREGNVQKNSQKIKKGQAQTSIC